MLYLFIPNLDFCLRYMLPPFIFPRGGKPALHRRGLERGFFMSRQPVKE